MNMHSWSALQIILTWKFPNLQYTRRIKQECPHPYHCTCVTSVSLWVLSSVAVYTVHVPDWAAPGTGPGLVTPAQLPAAHPFLEYNYIYIPFFFFWVFVCIASVSIWRHGSASILGTTRTDTRAPILMYWAGLSRIRGGTTTSAYAQ